VTLLSCLFAAALVGCSGGGSAATSAPPASRPPPASQPPPGTTATGGSNPAPVHTPHRLVGFCSQGPVCDDFATPSGDIKCFATARQHGVIECTIGSGLQPPAPRGTCELDQNGLVLHATGAAAAPNCRSDPTPAGLDPKIPPLAYGRTWSAFGLSCVSRTTGMTCTNGAGHGFFLSRERWRTY
jgi:hypothetical protein